MFMGSRNRSAQPPDRVTESATDARQGVYGRPVFGVLVGGLVLALVVLGAVEICGESIDVDPQPAPSEPAAATSGQPSGSGTFDDNPAGGSSRQPEATDRDPTPTGNGGGPTMVTTPNGAEKTR